jgi:uncharacterized membrane protein
VLDAHLQEWLNLAVRWTHVVVGIAWIGTSFYFNWLNNNVRPPEYPEPGVGGELWSVHGGGFYLVVKYQVAPEHLPVRLHWFKWEAYATWITGFCLLFIVYYLGPIGLSVDPTKADLARWAVAVIGLGSFAVGWGVYDGLCRTRLVDHPGWFAAIGLCMATAAAWGYSQYLTGRAAYIHTGALIGTIMAANVFGVIIPSQRVMVDAMSRGETPDPRPGADAARRSLHNNYLTLPVVFIMVSNHFPSTFGAAANWALLAVISLTGAFVRHWFNLRGQGHRNVWILPGAFVAMVGLAFVTIPRMSDGSVSDEVWSVVEARCVPCHSSTPTQAGFTAPPKGITFDTRSDLAARADLVAQVVGSDFMPLGNATEMTTEERALVVAWAKGA